MSEKLWVRTALVVLLLAFCNIRGSVAQVSLLPEHTITVNGVTLIRDAKKDTRWYYVPERPHLLERNPSDASDPRPSFQLVTYQARQNADLYEGGMLQFSVSMAISAKEKANLETELRKKLRLKRGDLLTIAPLPYHKAEATLYGAGGEITAWGGMAPGLAPAFVTGALPFQLKLDKFGADLYSGLVDKKDSGVGVLMTLAFDGLLPPAGFKVTVNWDQTFKYISNSSETKVALGSYFSGIDIGISKTKIREELVSNSCIKVESLTNESVTDEKIDRYLDPVIAKIQTELIEKIKAPEKIDLASRNKPDFMDKCFFPLKVDITVTMREVTQVRKGSETFEFNESVIVERKTACGTFIGINSYPENVKKALIRAMPLDSWASAFLLLPGVENTPELHISSVNMTANVVDAKGNSVETLSDTARWSSDSPFAWKNKDGEETGSLKFPLMALFDKHNKNIEAIRKEYRFKVDVQIEQNFGGVGKISTTKTSYFSPLFDGDLPLSAPVDLVDNIIFDVSALTFGSDNGLKKLRIQVKKGKSGEKLEYTFPPRNSDELSVVFIVESAKEDTQVEELIGSVNFDSVAGKRIPWEHNGKNLREVDSSLAFMLFDSDWEAR